VSDGQRYAILTELMSRSLAQLLLDAHQVLEWPSPLISIALQTAQAMAYLHGRGVIHGDLKPANVLLGRAPLFHVKICDFGEARRFEQSPGGSFLRLEGASACPSPQVADLWAFGGILIHMELRKPPFNPAPNMPWVMRMARGEAQPSPRWPTSVGDLALRCALPTFAVGGQGCGEACSKDGWAQELTFEGCAATLMSIRTHLGASPASGAGSSFVEVLCRDASPDERFATQTVSPADSCSDSQASCASTALAHPALRSAALPSSTILATRPEMSVASEWCGRRAADSRDQGVHQCQPHGGASVASVFRRRKVSEWLGVASTVPQYRE
jgi:serine/threonine protein kinase